MAEKGLQRSQPKETSDFIEFEDNHFQIIEAPEAESQLSPESHEAQRLATPTASDEAFSGSHRVTSAAGIIMRIGRGVKSAVGAVGGAVNRLTGEHLTVF